MNYIFVVWFKLCYKLYKVVVLNVKSVDVIIYYFFINILLFRDFCSYFDVIKCFFIGLYNGYVIY